MAEERCQRTVRVRHVTEDTAEVRRNDVVRHLAKSLQLEYAMCSQLWQVPM